MGDSLRHGDWIKWKGKIGRIFDTEVYPVQVRFIGTNYCGTFAMSELVRATDEERAVAVAMKALGIEEQWR